MKRIKILDVPPTCDGCDGEVFLGLRDNPIPEQPALVAVHLEGVDLPSAPTAAGMLESQASGAADVRMALEAWRVLAPDELLRRLRGRTRVLVRDTSFEEARAGRPSLSEFAVARIQPEFLSPAVAAEIAWRAHWPITQLQMAECIARACSLGQWPAPVVNLSTFSVRLQFEGERLRLIHIGRDGVAGGDLKAAERIRYVRDCEAGRFSISTPVEVFEGSGQQDRAVQILAEVGRVIGAQPYENALRVEGESRAAGRWTLTSGWRDQGRNEQIRASGSKIPSMHAAPLRHDDRERMR